jgi:hypothetical protein
MNALEPTYRPLLATELTRVSSVVRTAWYFLTNRGTAIVPLAVNTPTPGSCTLHGEELAGGRLVKHTAASPETLWSLLAPRCYRASLEVTEGHGGARLRIDDLEPFAATLDDARATHDGDLFVTVTLPVGRGAILDVATGARRSVFITVGVALDGSELRLRARRVTPTGLWTQATAALVRANGVRAEPAAPSFVGLLAPSSSLLRLRARDGREIELLTHVRNGPTSVVPSVTLALRDEQGEVDRVRGTHRLGVSGSLGSALLAAGLRYSDREEGAPESRASVHSPPATIRRLWVRGTRLFREVPFRVADRRDSEMDFWIRLPLPQPGARALLAGHHSVGPLDALTLIDAALDEEHEAELTCGVRLRLRRRARPAHA